MPPLRPNPPLRALLEVTRALRAHGDVPSLLAAVARTIAKTLGYESVVISLYRPAWDDFEVAAAHGVAGLGEGLVLPMLHSDGHTLGLLAVERREGVGAAGKVEIEVLEALAAHTAFAVQAAQESAESERHQLALERLLDVSSHLTAEPATDEIMRGVCEGVRDALGFENVLAALRHPQTGRLEPRASVGWVLAEIERDAPVFVHDIEGLLDPAFDVEGCYLLPCHEAERRIAGGRRLYVSRQNGLGPRAWDQHWLLVPLYDGGGEVIGVLWADEPEDRLLPSHAKLQALRVFANQAAAAVVASAHLTEVRFLADHDSLTRLLNRRAFVDRLDGEVARAGRYGHTFGLVLCDLDGFKELNDRLGHPAGDAALQEFAQTLMSALRKGDEAFRIGGDEFALLLAEASEGDAREVVRRVAGKRGSTRASFGVASCPENAQDSQTLFRLADAALYEAKRNGTGLQFVA